MAEHKHASSLAICVVEVFKDTKCLEAYAYSFRQAKRDLTGACLLRGERAVLSFWDYREGPWPLHGLEPNLIERIEIHGKA